MIEAMGRGTAADGAIWVDRGPRLRSTFDDLSSIYDPGARMGSLSDPHPNSAIALASDEQRKRAARRYVEYRGAWTGRVQQLEGVEESMLMEPGEDT